MEKCKACGGSGRLKIIRKDLLCGYIYEKCPDCHGTGSVEKADNPPRCYVCSEVLIDGVCPNKCDIDVVIKKAKEKADNDGLIAQAKCLCFSTWDKEYKTIITKEAVAQYKTSLLERLPKRWIPESWDIHEEYDIQKGFNMCLAEVKALIEGDK
jgi:hypothetical protein